MRTFRQSKNIILILLCLAGVIGGLWTAGKDHYQRILIEQQTLAAQFTESLEVQLRALATAIQRSAQIVPVQLETVAALDDSAGAEEPAKEIFLKAAKESLSRLHPAISSLRLIWPDGTGYRYEVGGAFTPIQQAAIPDSLTVRNTLGLIKDPELAGRLAIFSSLETDVEAGWLGASFDVRQLSAPLISDDLMGRLWLVADVGTVARLHPLDRENPQGSIQLAPGELGQILGSEESYRLRHPQDVTSGSHQRFGNDLMLRRVVGNGIWHVIHQIPQQTIRQAVYPRLMAPSITGAIILVLIGLLIRTRRRLRETRDSLSTSDFLFHNSRVAQLLVNVHENRILRVNRSAARLFGYPLSTLRAVPFSNLCRPVASDAPESPFGGTVHEARLSGNQRILVDVIAAVSGNQPSGIQQYFIFSAEAMDKRDESIRFQAYYDPLTRLPNRSFLFEHLQKMLASHRRENQSFAVLFVDLDRFKQVNDTLGHDVGDKVLLEVARRLQSRLRESDLLARLGGDEFTIILPHIRDDLDASLVARSVVQTLSEPMDVAGYDVRIGASVGISVFPQSGEDPQTLLKNADIAMYQAKDQGRGAYCFFEERMNAALNHRIDLERDIGNAIANDEMQLYLQPIVELDRESIVGAETLIRWHHPRLGVLMPSDFISVAEETGNIADIAEWALVKTIEKVENWLERGQIDSRFFLAINMSHRQLINPGHVQRWQDILKKSRLSNKRVFIELDEGLLKVESTEVSQVLNQLSLSGLQLTLDNFGSSSSSLKLLREFPVNALKVDLTRVQCGHGEQREAQFAEALIRLGTTMDLTLIAIGIEDRRQLDGLREAGCHYAQGFLFGEAITAEAFSRVLALQSSQSAVES